MNETKDVKLAERRAVIQVQPTLADGVEWQPGSKTSVLHQTTTFGHFSAVGTSEVSRGHQHVDTGRGTSKRAILSFPTAEQPHGCPKP